MPDPFTLFDGYIITLNDTTEYTGHPVEINIDNIILHEAYTNKHIAIQIADVFLAIPATPSWMTPT